LNKSFSKINQKNMPDLGSKKILIVDDNSDNITLLKKHLSMYNCDTALTGESALTMAEINKPDLILLDIMMPGMNGFSVAKRLKENPETADIPIIFITAQTDLGRFKEGFDLAEDELIMKPYHADVVQQSVKNKLIASEESNSD